jgi:hypothetical protein
MRFHNRFKLPREDQHDVDPAWFDQQKRRSVQGNDSSLRDWLATAVSALKAFHDAHLDADEAALCMIDPLSTSPVPALGGYSDHTLGLSNFQHSGDCSTGI